MAVRTPTKQELAALLAAHGIADFISGGKFAKYELRALKSMLKKLGPPAARTAPRVGGTAWLIAKRHPVLAVGSLIAAGIAYPEERDQLIQDIIDGTEFARDLVDQGRNIIEREFGRNGMRGPAGSGIRRLTEFDYSRGRSLGMPDRADLGRSTPTPRKKVSKYNKVISAAMKVIKKSKTNGKSGSIKNAKSAFKTAVKTVKAYKRTKKIAKSGIKRQIGLAAKRLGY
jgi:hypothetical protein